MKKIWIYILSSLIIVAVLVCGIFLRSPTSTEVFEKSIQSIVCNYSKGMYVIYTKCSMESSRQAMHA